MTLGQKQELFARLLPRLLDRARSLGFKVRLKELLRAPEQAEYYASHCRRCGKEEVFHAHSDHDFKPIGIRDSLHCDGLAIDLVLFKDGVPLWSSEDYAELGVFWEQLHSLCAWGGRFDDGGHFSLKHGGRQ